MEGPENRVQAVKEGINPMDLPDPVRQALKNASPNESITHAEKINRDGRVGYAVELAGVRGKHIVLVTEDGKIVKDDMKPEDQMNQDRREDATQQQKARAQETRNVQNKKEEAQDRRHK